MTGLFFRFMIFASIAWMVISCETVFAQSSKKISQVVDHNGNKYPIKKMADGKLWIAADLKLEVPNSYCYNNDPKNCEKYGRLYLWETANQVCNSLGAGWRLPSGEEWLQLSKANAAVGDDSTQVRKAAFKNLMKGAPSGFDAVLGGGRGLDGAYGRLDAHGFYWTSTETDSASAWFANFAKGSQALYIQRDGEKARAFAVRCVKSIKK